MSNYLIEYEHIGQKSIHDFLKVLRKTRGIKLDALKVKDLSYHNNKPIVPAAGVYLFRRKKEVIYVGTAKAMSFTQRIPGNFDTRPHEEINRMLRLYAEINLGHEKPTQEDLQKASKKAFKELNLVLIQFKNEERINRTERMLLSSTKAYNKIEDVRLSKEDCRNLKVDDY